MSKMDSNYPRVDAIADLYISVTAEDIRAGVPRDHCNCAVAHAIKRAVGTPEAKAVIYPSVAYVLMPAEQKTTRSRTSHGSGAAAGRLAWHRFLLPTSLTAQVIGFDHDQETTGGTFTFQAPRATQTLRAKRERIGTHGNAGKRAVAVRMPWIREKGRLASILAEQELEVAA